MRRLLLPTMIVLGFVGLAFFDDSVTIGASTWVMPARVGLAVVFLLAWRLRRGRIAWAALSVALVTESLALASPESAEDLRLAVGIAAPWVLGVMAWMPEWWVASRAGWMRFLMLAAVVGLAWGLTLDTADPIVERLASWGQSEAPAAALETPASWSSRIAGRLREMPVPPAVPISGAAGLLLALTALRRRRTPVEAGLAGALVAMGFGYGASAGLHYYGLAAATVLGAALVENAFVLAFHDALTGLPARRALEERLGQIGRKYALAMLDLDHFKQFNDKHGHEVGDQILRLVASRMRKVAGGGEAFRYGGEEFTVVFAGRGAAEAKAYMDALREDIAGRKFTVRSPGRPGKKPKGAIPRKPAVVTKQLKVTVSVGVAERSAKYPQPEDVMKAADQALYRSKKAGRNCVTVAK